MPKGVDFEFEATDEIPEPDLWEGEQWEVCGFRYVQDSLHPNGVQKRPLNKIYRIAGRGKHLEGSYSSVACGGRGSWCVCSKDIQ
jgi:hypothetical protein